MKIQADIERRLQARFDPVYMDVVNESHKHHVPPGSESHFKVTLATAEFAGKSPVARHRLVNQTLAEPLAAGVHALSLKLYTPEQWQAAGGDVHLTPVCTNNPLPNPGAASSKD